MSNNSYNFLETLKAERDRLRKELEQIETLISIRTGVSAPKKESGQLELQTTKGQTGQKSGVSLYKRGGTAKYKILYSLKKLGRFSHSSEIKKLIAELDGQGLGKTNISANLSLLKNSKHIIKHQVGDQNRNTFWGLPEWIDGDGNILKGHEYNDELLFKPNDYKNI